MINNLRQQNVPVKQKDTYNYHYIDMQDFKQSLSELNDQPVDTQDKSSNLR